MPYRRRILRIARKLHIWVGLTVALYFMLIAATGVAMNHREGLRLEDRAISRSWLPNSYRPDDGAEVRADIVITDIHSGLILGRSHVWIEDTVAAVWFLSILTGITMLIVRRSMHHARSKAVYQQPDTSSAATAQPSEPETVGAASRN